MSGSPAGWRGFHLFYHGDRDLLLAGPVRACVAELAGDGLIRRHFWVRFNLGGPHVRLRLEVAPADAPAVAERVRGEAEAFFRRHPSTASLSDDVVRAQGRTIVHGDPAEGDADTVFPDNSVAELPVRHEVERYGGPVLHGHSLDLFALSSAEVLRLLAAHPTLTAGQRLVHGFRLLVRQAWGHAADEAEFARLVGYASRSAPAPMRDCIATADAAFERQRAVLCGVLRAETASLAGEGGVAPLAEGARTLAAALAGLDARRREEIAASHLHMTANRVGLLNREEVYLGRLLERAVDAHAAADPAGWAEAWAAHAASLAASPSSSS